MALQATILCQKLQSIKQCHDLEPNPTVFFLKGQPCPPVWDPQETLPQDLAGVWLTDKGEGPVAAHPGQGCGFLPAQCRAWHGSALRMAKLKRKRPERTSPSLTTARKEATDPQADMEYVPVWLVVPTTVLGN